MNLDELDRVWRAANEVAATKEQRDQLIAATCRRVERFWGRIYRRDVVETSQAVFVIIFLAGIAMLSQPITLFRRLAPGSWCVGLCSSSTRCIGREQFNGRRRLTLPCVNSAELSWTD